MPKPFRILSFDTSTSCLSVALQEDGCPKLEESCVADGLNRQESATMLLPVIDRLLKQQDWDKTSLSALVVCAGPGSFTGVRNSIVTARTLAQALDLPLIPVSRFECLASAFSGPAAIVLSAAGKHVFAAAFDCRLGNLTELVAPSYIEIESARQLLASIPVWYVEAELLSHPGLPAACKPLPLIKNIAAQGAKIAYNRLSLKAPAGSEAFEAYTRTFCFREVEPLYLRGPSVTVEKDHGYSHKQTGVG